MKKIDKYKDVDIKIYHVTENTHTHTNTHSEKAKTHWENMINITFKYSKIYKQKLTWK